MPGEVIAQSGPGAVVTPKAAPAAAAVVPAAAPAKSPEVVAMEAKLAETERKHRIMLQRQSEKLTGEAKKEREGLGPKLARLAEFEKQEAAAKINKSAYAKAKWGDDWYEQLTNEKINGGAPTADVVASEMAKMEEKFEARLRERDEQAEKARADAELQSVAQSRREQESLASEFWGSVSKDFPLVEGLGTPEEVSKELARRREQHYDSTSKRDESGRLIVHGQILPLQKVVELWEGQLVKLAERAAGHEKYAEKFRPKPAVAAPKDVGQRRTLSNDLTGSTPARSAPANDVERRARAIAAFEATRKPST